MDGKESYNEVIEHFMGEARDTEKNYEIHIKQLPVPVPVPKRDGTILGFFPAGIDYLSDVGIDDLLALDDLIDDWETITRLGIDVFQDVIKEKAGEMDDIYSFLSLRTKPIIDPHEDEIRPSFELYIEPQDRSYMVGFLPKDHIKETFWLHDDFRREFHDEIAKNIVRKAIEDGMGRERYEGPITRSEIKGFEKEIGIEEEESLDRIEKLKEEVINNYNKENAQRLYSAVGECDEFYDTIKRGLNNDSKNKD